MRMNLSLFLTIYVSSILFLLVFHIMFLGLWYIGLVARVAGKKPEIWTIIQNCAVSSDDALVTCMRCLLSITAFACTYKSVLMALLFVQVISIACCVFYSHCGNRAILRQKPFERRNSNWFSFWKKEERNTWVSKFIRMNELKDQVCSSWFAPVGSASDYPLLSKWVIYGEVLLEAIPSPVMSVIPCFLSLIVIFCFLSWLVVAHALVHQMKSLPYTHYGLHLQASILPIMWWKDHQGEQSLMAQILVVLNNVKAYNFLLKFYWDCIYKCCEQSVMSQCHDIDQQSQNPCPQCVCV